MNEERKMKQTANVSIFVFYDRNYNIAVVIKKTIGIKNWHIGSKTNKRIVT